MNLKEAIKETLELESEEFFVTIYARRINGQWIHDSPAMLVKRPYASEEDDPGLKIDDMEYFLESFVAQEVLEDYIDITNEQNPTFDQIVNLIINYAEYDCYPDPDEGWDFKVYD